MIEKTIEINDFEYRIRFHHAEDGIKFDIIDNILTNGEFIDDIVSSGKIDMYGHLDIECFCDVNFIAGFGELIKFIYETSLYMMEIIV